MKRWLFGVGVAAAVCGAIVACVGDDPQPATTGGGDSGASDAPASDGSPGADASDAAGGPLVIAKGQSFPIAIAVLGDVVYWANQGGAATGCTDTSDGSIMSARVDGTEQPRTVAQGLACPSSLVVTADKVYWAERGTKSGGASGKAFGDGSVHSAGHDGSSPATLVPNLELPLGLRAEGDRLFYFTGPADGIDALWRLPMAGGSPLKLASVGKSASGLTLDGAKVYWTEDGAGNLWRMPNDDDGGAAGSADAGDGGTKEKLAGNLPLPANPAIVGANLYWVNRAGTCSVGKWSAAAGAGTLAADLGIPREQPANAAGCRQLAADDQYVYVTSFTSNPVRVAVAGGTVAKLADLPATTALAVTPDSVYVGSGGASATIYRIAK